MLYNSYSVLYNCYMRLKVMKSVKKYNTVLEKLSKGGVIVAY